MRHSFRMGRGSCAISTALRPRPASGRQRPASDPSSTQRDLRSPTQRCTLSVRVRVPLPRRCAAPPHQQHVGTRKGLAGGRGLQLRAATAASAVAYSSFKAGQVGGTGVGFGHRALGSGTKRSDFTTYSKQPAFQRCAKIGIEAFGIARSVTCTRGGLRVYTNQVVA